MNRKQILAFVLFASIPLISVIYLFYASPQGLGWGGIPLWLWGFVLIEAMYCGIMYWFIKKVWR